MNEQACAFVCAIFSAICAVLFGYCMKTGDASCVSVAMAMAGVVVVISGLVLVCRHM